MSDQEDTHFGIFWVRAMDGRWVSATPGEACAEIVRLREALREIAANAAMPGDAVEQCLALWRMARAALAGR